MSQLTNQISPDYCILHLSQISTVFPTDHCFGCLRVLVYCQNILQVSTEQGVVSSVGGWRPTTKIYQTFTNTADVAGRTFRVTGDLGGTIFSETLYLDAGPYPGGYEVCLTVAVAEPRPVEVTSLKYDFKNLQHDEKVLVLSCILKMWSVADPGAPCSFKKNMKKTKFFQPISVHNWQ